MAALLRAMQRQAVDALGKRAVDAVLDAGAAALIAKRHGSRTGQTESIIEPLEQQLATVTDDVATIKCGLDNSPSNAPKLWSHRYTLTSAVLGFHWLQLPTKTRLGTRPPTCY